MKNKQKIEDLNSIINNPSMPEGAKEDARAMIVKLEGGSKPKEETQGEITERNNKLMLKVDREREASRKKKEKKDVTKEPKHKASKKAKPAKKKATTKVAPKAAEPKKKVLKKYVSHKQFGTSKAGSFKKRVAIKKEYIRHKEQLKKISKMEHGGNVGKKRVGAMGLLFGINVTSDKFEHGGSVQSMTTKELAHKLNMSMIEVNNQGLSREDLIALVSDGN